MSETLNQSAAKNDDSGARQLANFKNLTNLHEADESPLDLSSEYWSPEVEGESKLGIPVAVQDSTYVDNETGEEMNLPCLIFVEQKKDGQLKVVRNGSKRLVATILNAVNAGTIEFQKTPVKITFAGKQKNSTNAFKSDRWSVKPLLVNNSKI